MPHLPGIKWLAAALCALAALTVCGTASGAFAGLPPSTQVNDDPPSIDPAQSAGLSDLTTGSLIAGNPRVPWVAFAQRLGSSQQIFVRAFKAGAWHTEGFPESLNVDPAAVAQAPSIDFTGPNRTVPWVAWAEPSTRFSGTPTEIFASRFLSQPAPAQNGGQWVHEGQELTATAPSLNINVGRTADDPALIGGTTTAGANPAPWITWQEAGNGATQAPTGSPNLPKGSSNSTFQIFVSHAVPATNATCPSTTKPNRGNSVGNFCFQQVGIDRIPSPVSGSDPSLNVDPTRDGIQGDIAFTGPNDTVPWVVWYENSDNGTVTDGLFNGDMVFAARAVADTSGDGGFHWQVVGLGTAGKTSSQDILNTSGPRNHFGDCGESQAAEQACSLDANSATGLTDGNGAENPQVTAGTMVPGKNTTPWIAWDESSTNGGGHAVFVARLDPAGDHFDLLNNGQPISNSGVESTRPDIVFSHNTPYVSWHEQVGSTALTFVGHFEGNPADPVFHLDTPNGIPTVPTAASDDDITDLRSPLASTCPADPFTQDGSACQGGTVGTPLFAYNQTVGSGSRGLFAQGYTPGAAITGAASSVAQNSAAVSGTLNTDGAATRVHFDFGTTTAYGASTTATLLAPAAGVATPVTAALAGLPAGVVIHYRIVAQTDFGTVDGQDATFTTVAAPPRILHASLRGVSKRKAKLKLTIAAASNGPSIGAIRIKLPRGLRFSHSKRTLSRGIAVRNAAGGSLSFTFKRTGGALEITLAAPTTEVTVKIGHRAISVSGRLAHRIKRRKVKHVKVKVSVLDATGATTRFALKLSVH